jgi:phage tail-like protein
MPVVRTDPIRNFKFEVTFIPLEQGDVTGVNAPSTANLGQFAAGINNIGFAAMSGLTVQNEVIQYREGGMNTHPHKMVGQTDFAPVTFNRGVITGQDQLWKWQRFIHNWQAGAGGSTGGSDYRCDIIVRVFDHPHSNASYNDSILNETKTKFLGTPKLAMKIFNCWPGGYVMNGLNAGANELLIQEMTLHNEGWILAWTEDEINKIATAK